MAMMTMQRGARLWRLEQRQSEVIIKLDRLYDKIEEFAQTAEHQRWQMRRDIETIAKLLEDLMRRPTATTNSAGLFGEPTVVKIVLGGLLSLIAALAFGKAFVFPV